MIIVHCNNYYITYKSKLIRCDYNHYISAIEYIDNKIDDVIFKKTNKMSIIYRDLKGDYHNPIGPAKILLKKDGSIHSQYYFIRGIDSSDSRCYKL